jgi:dinuclear metal center YbgI/SA1388 family protein
MVLKVKDIIAMLETIAPASMAEAWDNVGLQVGERKWPVKNIWIALDPTLDVVTQACKKGADLLITHHPLIFSPLRSIDTGTPIGKVIEMAMHHQMAIFAAHTNLDSAANGLNEEFSLRIGLKDLKVLHKQNRNDFVKLVFFVPLDDEEKVLSALFETPAGRIGDYTSCSFRVQGKGTFKPGPSAKPFTGKRGEISHVEEIRIETVLQRDDIPAVLEHIKARHSYETMAYDIYPIHMNEIKQGLGRIGDLERNMKLFALAEKIKQVFKAASLRVVGRPNYNVKRVAVSTGSGSGLIDSFLLSGADVFISGDLHYHNARAVEAAGLALIDIGHFASERIVIDVLAERLRKVLNKNRSGVKIHKSEVEKDPFVIL